ncbi:MAG TPA: hypothetical protein VL463_21375 [Kofleriaceae bacterium]|nr:hypothetical protein [Kofleriaceae bacterium]
MKTIVIAVVLIFGAAAVADTPRAAAIAARLSAGEKEYADQDYAAAIKTLMPVTRDPAATRAQRLHALELIALAQFIRRDEAAARDTFERILDIDPGYQLRDDSGSPRIREFFEQIKRDLVPGYGAAAELDHAAPSSATAGRKVELDVRAVRGAPQVTDVIVYVRRRGELGYRAIAAAPHGDARWRATWSLDPSRTAYELDYYVEARGPAGEATGRIASPEDPLPLHVAAGGGAERDRWYTRWYVVAGAAVVVGGATTAAIFAAKSGAGPGTLSPGTITLSP